MVPKQLNEKSDLDTLYELLEKRIPQRKPSRFLYVEHSDGHMPVTYIAGELTFHAIVESNTVDRVAKISGTISALGLRDNGVRSKLYIYLHGGPLLIVEQGARFELL
jgi:hypothetical protein